MLLVALVPPLGIAGAGIALCGAYVVMLTVMHLLTRRLFAVAFEWRRLAHLTVGDGRDRGTSATCCCRPTACVGLLSRAAALAADRAGAAT